MTEPYEHKDETINGVKLHYLEAGGGDGLPLVLLHGWPQTSYAWRKLIPLVSEQRRVIAPDLRGFGDSDKPEAGYDKKTVAADIIGLLGALGIERAAILGHDWGGWVAYRIALDAPDLTERLIILNMTCPFNATTAAQVYAPQQVAESWYWYMFQIPDFPEAVFEGKEELLLRHFHTHWSAIPNTYTDADFAEFTRAFRTPGALRGGFNYYRTMFAQDLMDWGEHMGHVYPMPSLLLWGDKDPVIPPAWLEGIDACFADLRIERHADAGHFIGEEAPDWCAGHINGFLDGV